MTISIWGDDNIDEWLTQVEIALDEWDQGEVCEKGVYNVYAHDSRRASARKIKNQKEAWMERKRS